MKYIWIKQINAQGSKSLERAYDKKIYASNKRNNRET